jgi:hypothetical protein
VPFGIDEHGLAEVPDMYRPFTLPVLPNARSQGKPSPVSSTGRRWGWLLRCPLPTQNTPLHGWLAWGCKCRWPLPAGGFFLLERLFVRRATTRWPPPLKRKGLHPQTKKAPGFPDASFCKMR